MATIEKVQECENGLEREKGAKSLLIRDWINEEEQEEQEVQEVQEEKGAMSLEEKIDLNALRIIRDNFPKIWSEQLNRSSFKMMSLQGVYAETDYDSAFTIVNTYYSQKVKTNKIDYRYNSKTKEGRRYSKTMSLQLISRKIRHAIAKNIYYDIDVNACHPTFTQQLCKKYKSHHPNLDLYLSNRSFYLQSLIGTELSSGERLTSKDDVKTYFLQVGYGGGSNQTSSEFLNQFYDDQQVIMNTLYRHPDFKKNRFRVDNAYKKGGKKYGERDNRKGTCMSYILTAIENVVLTHMEVLLQEKGISYGALCFDGVMITKDDVEDITELVRDLEKYLLEKMGYPIRLSNKEMNEALDLTGLFIKDDLKTSDEDLSKYLIEKLKDDILYSPYHNDYYFWNSELALWRLQKPHYLRTLITPILEPYLETGPDPKIIDEFKSLIKTDKFQASIIRMCIPYLETRDDSSFIRTTLDSISGLLPIADNKTIVLRTGEVRPRVKTDYFTKTTNNRIVDITQTRESLLTYHSDLLKTDDPLYRDSLISTIAYMLTGDCLLKKIFEFFGKGGDNGKSCFLDFLSCIFEEFAGSTSHRLFVEQKNESCHDSEMFALLGLRLAYISETAEGIRLNENRLKAISGMDEQTIRGAGEKKSVKVKFTSILAMITNNDHKIEDPVFAGRLIFFNFCNTFKKSEEFPIWLKQHKNHFFTLYAEFAKKYYDDKQQIHFTPQVLNYTKDKINNQDSFKSWIAQANIEKGGEVSADVLFDFFLDFCSSSSMKMLSKIVFNKKIKEMFGVETVQRRVGENKPYFFIGISQKL